MNEGLQIGPLVLSSSLLLALGSLFLGSWAGGRVGRRNGVDIEPLLWGLLLLGAVLARAAFVLQFSDAYRQAPLDILDLRDGGWTPLAGFVAAALGALALGLRRRPLRLPLAVALGTVAVVWTLGLLVLANSTGTAQRLPDLALPGLDGRPVALTDFRGKPTVVNLWASWCPPCRREMPVLQEAQARRPDLNVVFINQGESLAQVQKFMRSQQLPLHHVLLDARGDAGARLGQRALPTTFFFDADGRLVDTRVGELSHATLAQRLAHPSLQPKLK